MSDTSSVRSLLGSGSGRGSPTWASVALELAGVGIAAAVFVLFGELVGLLAAATLVIIWVVFPVEYAIAAGQVGIVSVAAAPLPLTVLVGVEAGLTLLLAGALVTAAASLTASAAWLLAYVGVAGGIWYVVGGPWQVWHVAVLLWAVVAVGGYALHRYELVSLGLTEGDHHR
ncbi:hypothetical protein NDI76_16250 [Halogeometricum sp. S1BR25-6]|uniref:DUF8163 domain-containing protein n=1 Tax=Halogeometricum salsisoli TaxID=2950536 RepID=A0ABU2GHN9_9EURY|nr:hypothetical protein [Halogeometricum sp. S1BR25-6]MDS0300299.1 hypothetical protein [Halogeometricum sp. S1BR25-6]